MDDAVEGVEDAAVALIRCLRRLGKKAAAAESCTAGLAADLIARIPGASRVFWGSFVTYSIDAKILMLGIDGALIQRFGAVSRETALAMAEGALKKSGADYAFSVTGLAGPDGDGSGLPVGTVWIATALTGGESRALAFSFLGERNEIRVVAAHQAIRELLNRLSDTQSQVYNHTSY
jgi:PncC family amidohydrolase